MSGICVPVSIGVIQSGLLILMSDQRDPDGAAKPRPSQLPQVMSCGWVSASPAQRIRKESDPATFYGTTCDFTGERIGRSWTNRSHRW